MSRGLHEVGLGHTLRREQSLANNMSNAVSKRGGKRQPLEAEGITPKLRFSKSTSALATPTQSRYKENNNPTATMEHKVKGKNKYGGIGKGKSKSAVQFMGESTLDEYSSLQEVRTPLRTCHLSLVFSV